MIGVGGVECMNKDSGDSGGVGFIYLARWAVIVFCSAAEEWHQELPNSKYE